MKTVPLSTASRSLAKYAAGSEIVVLTKGKKAVAAIVSLRNVDRESLALSMHPEFLELIAKARSEVRSGHTYSLEALRREFGSSRRASRARRRAARDGGRRPVRRQAVRGTRSK